MNHFSNALFFIVCLLLFTSCKKQDNIAEVSKEWIQLFNGKDLNDWNIKIKGYPLNENVHNTFRIEDSILKVSYDQYDKFDENYGHIFYKKPFSSYKLKVQYRFTGEQIEGAADWAHRNSGVMIHSQSPESMAIDQKFPLCIEVQMLGGITEGVPRPTGNLCTPGSNVVIDGELVTEHCINSTSKTYYGDQWVNLEVLVLKDSIISHKINGEKVLTYSKPQIGGGDMNEYDVSYKTKIGEFLKEGYISLQSESHPVEFKNIELLELDY